MEQNKIQTAVKWLESEINKYVDYYEGKRDATPYSLTDLDNAIIKANVMEKGQIIESFNKGQQKEAKQEFWDKAEEYYNETYGTK
jgi:hypothetical protein